MNYPYSPHFQERVFALLVQSPTFLNEYRDTIETSYFEDDSLRVLVDVALGYYDRYRVPPTRSSLFNAIEEYAKKYEHEPDDLLHLKRLADKCFKLDLKDMEYLRDKIVDFGKWQAVRAAVVESAEDIQAHPNEADVETLREKVRGRVEKAMQAGCGSEFGVNVFDFMSDPGRLMTDDGPFSIKHKVPTGFPTLDRILHGGPGAGELVVVAAESGLGKSMVLVNIGVNATRVGKRGIYFTLELKPPDVTVRCLSRMARVPQDDVLAGSALFHERMDKSGWLKAKGRMMHVKYFPPGEATVGMLRSYTSRFVARTGHRPEFIIVDYADELRSEKTYKDGNLYLPFGDIYSQLIAFASDWKVPIWTASQLNRSGYSEESPGLQSISDSLKKVMKADAVLLLAQTEEERQAYRGRLIAAKIRRGASRIPIHVQLRYDRALVAELKVVDGGGSNGAAPAPVAANAVVEDV